MAGAPRRLCEQRQWECLVQAAQLGGGRGGGGVAEHAAALRVVGQMTPGRLRARAAGQGCPAVALRWPPGKSMLTACTAGQSMSRAAACLPWTVCGAGRAPGRRCGSAAEGGQFGQVNRIGGERGSQRDPAGALPARGACASRPREGCPGAGAGGCARAHLYRSVYRSAIQCSTSWRYSAQRGGRGRVEASGRADQKCKGHGTGGVSQWPTRTQACSSQRWHFLSWAPCMPPHTCAPRPTRIIRLRA